MSVPHSVQVVISASTFTDCARLRGGGVGVEEEGDEEEEEEEQEEEKEECISKVWVRPSL